MPDFLKLFLPVQPCVLCGVMSHDGLCCQACDADLPYFKTPNCPLCALPTTRGEICGHCLKKAPLFSSTSAAFIYQFPIDHLIQSFKYHEQLNLSTLFAEKLIRKISERPDFIIAMPLHPAKLKTRGFNQAHLIAEPLARSLHIPLLNHACHRLRDTPSQTSLPWKARSQNMRGAFSCVCDLTDKHVALVDDVLTTGASLNELAQAVLKQGAKKISCWVVARTIEF
jgi:ComF family protein